MTATLIEFVHGDYTVSSDPERVDLDTVHHYLANDSYWAQGRSRQVMARALANTPLMIGAYDATGAQVGFARMVSDLATYAWLCDVFVLPPARGVGLGVAMVGAIVEHPDVAGVGLQFLATRDAHDLYARFGYRPIDTPTKFMLRQPV